MATVKSIDPDQLPKLAAIPKFYKPITGLTIKHATLVNQSGVPLEE